MGSDTRVRPTSALLMMAGIVLVAANMRAAASSVGPLLAQIRDDVGLSSTAAGALTTLPVLCFGAVAPLAPTLARKMGYTAAVGAALVGVVTGLVVRLIPGVFPLYLGTLVAGAGIAVGNVLLPVLVKRNFPDRVGIITGVYVTVLVGSAALAAGVTVPIANALGHSWRAGLGIWAIPALIALLVWAPQLTRPEHTTGSRPERGGTRSLLRDPLAWQVTAFFGLQSASFYIILSWLPTIFQSHGETRSTGGLLLGISMISGLPGALLLPGWATRAKDQRALAVIFSGFVFAGLTGLLIAPVAVPYLWVVLLGIGQQALFPLALTLVVLRSRNVSETASLSTLMQSGGYMLAAVGPIAAGALHDATNSWRPTIVVLLCLVLLQMVFGVLAGRARHLTAPTSGGAMSQAPAVDVC
jgi:MFS transporter, CP family, cyanate transporter